MASRATSNRVRRAWPIWTIQVDLSAVDQRDAEGVFERVCDLVGVRLQGGTLTMSEEEADA